MVEKEKIHHGDKVFFLSNGKELRATVERKNEKTIVIVLDDGRKGRIGYQLAFLEPNVKQKITARANFLEKSDITTNAQLKILLERVKNEYKHVFVRFNDQKGDFLLRNVHIFFGTVDTYQKGGHYSVKKNEIMICKSLQRSPDWVIMQIIYHECLHVYVRSHGTSFRALENLYKRKSDVDEYLVNLFMANKAERAPRKRTVQKKNISRSSNFSLENVMTDLLGFLRDAD